MVHPYFFNHLATIGFRLELHILTMSHLKTIAQVDSFSHNRFDSELNGLQNYIV